MEWRSAIGSATCDQVGIPLQHPANDTNVTHCSRGKHVHLRTVVDQQPD
jgi:hypothetical protein